jgi:hypothetical protein
MYEKADRLRHSLALQYIKVPSVSVAQIARLGSEDQPLSIMLLPADGRSISEARAENQVRNEGKVSKLSPGSIGANEASMRPVCT